ncbi:unnamed protein product [Malus baccata var. baccata]
MNLTAVKEADEVMERHIEDSLAIIPPIRNSYLSHCSCSSENLRLVDVGSGAGLPGLILAIACPVADSCYFGGQLNTVFLWFVLAVCLLLQGATILRYVIEKSYHTHDSFVKSYPKCH